jgi:hypothetical protein
MIEEAKLEYGVIHHVDVALCELSRPKGRVFEMFKKRLLAVQDSKKIQYNPSSDP